jgi:RNA polymerase sigma-70 factor (ECF subfamily)
MSRLELTLEVYLEIAPPLPMSPFDTRATLLVRIRDPQDQASWREFVDLYMPLLHSYAIKMGFQDADAADAAQETLLRVSKAIGSGQYQSSKGSFRGWLLTVLRNTLRLHASRAKHSARGTGDTGMLELLREQPDRQQLDLWEREYQLRMFHWAAERVQSSFQQTTWKAFWETTVVGKSIASVAQELGVSTGAVYIARSRVLSSLRQEIELAEAWHDQPAEHR